jgi:hypothetical protein
MKKALAVCSLAALAVLGTSTPAYAEKPDEAAKNQVEYWAAQPGDCVKVEFGDGVMSFQLPDLDPTDRYYRLILKAGTVHEELREGLTELSWHSATSGKALSHVIYCTEDGGYGY